MKTKVIEMYDAETGEIINSCPHSKQKLKIKFDTIIEKGDILRNYDS